MSTSQVWRIDIEGLRGIAVLGVILFHFDSGALPGGYLGVDLFLVISGYLITQLLLERDYLLSFQAMREFFRRRFLRIFPTLIFALPIFAFVFSFLVLPQSHRSFFYTGAAALFGGANILLGRIATDYFSPDSNLNPFLHTWSVSLEDQFYVLYTVLLAACCCITGKKRLRLVVSFLALVGLAFAFHFGPASGGASFYSFPARFWQFLLGGVAYIFRSHIDSRPRAWLQSIGSFVQAFGIAYVIYAFIRFDELSATNRDYIDYSIVSALLLAFGYNGTSTSVWVLGNRYLRRIGLLSYSLYIFHFPVLKIFELFFDTRINDIVVLVFYLAACFVLSELNFRYIESKFISMYRTADSQSTRHAPSFAFAASLGAAAVLILSSMLLSTKVSRAVELEPGLTRPKPIGEVGTGPASLVIFGDSHAQSFYPLFRQISEKTGVKSVDRTGSACLLATDLKYLHNGKLRDTCIQFLEAEFAKILREPDDKRILFFGMRSLAYLSPVLISEEDHPVDGLLLNDGRIVHNEGHLLIDAYMASLDKLLSRFGEINQKVVFLAPLPELKVSTYRCFLRELKDECRVPRAINEAYREYFMGSLRSLATLHPNLRIWDPFYEICPTNECRNFVNGTPLYRDDDHPSTGTALRLETSFMNAVGDWLQPKRYVPNPSASTQ